MSLYDCLTAVSQAHNHSIVESNTLISITPC